MHKLILVFFLMISSLGAYSNNGKVVLKFDVSKQGTLNTIFIVDNSGSMQPFQDEVIATSDTYYNKVMSLFREHKTAVLSTDSSDPFYGIVTQDNKNPAFDFKNLIRSLGTNGSYEEMPFYSLTKELESLKNQNFFEYSEFLNIIIITDESEQSDSVLSNPVQDLLDQLKTYYQNDFMINSFIPTSLSQCTNTYTSSHHSFTSLEEITSLTNGSVYDICGDYSRAFEDMLNKVPSDNLVYLPFKKYQFRNQPIVNTIEVSYGTQMIPFGYLSTGFVYDDLTNSIVFGKAVQLDQSQPEGTQLEISFDIQ